MTTRSERTPSSLAGGGGFGLQVWSVFSYDFVASSSSVTLPFAQAGQVGLAIGGIGLDEVVITSTGDPAAVPEPASLSLLATGLAALAARRVRKRLER